MKTGRKLSDDDHGGVGTPRHHVQTNDAKGGDRGPDFRLGKEGGGGSGAMATSTHATETPGPVLTILRGVGDAWVVARKTDERKTSEARRDINTPPQHKYTPQ